MRHHAEGRQQCTDRLNAFGVAHSVIALTITGYGAVSYHEMQLREPIMDNPTVPDFTDLAARKLAELEANGYRITGVCFERQVEGTQPQRGFIDSWGFVGWWRPYMTGGSNADA